MKPVPARTLPVPYWLWPWCAFLFLVPFKQLVPGPPFIALELGAALMLALAPGRGASLATGRFLAVSLLFLCVCGSFFTSLFPAESKMPVLRIGAAYGAYVLAASVALTPRELKLALASWFAGGAAAGLALLLFGSAGLSGRASMNIGDYAAEPNFFIAELVMPAAIGLWLLTQGGRARGWALLGLAPMLGATLYTQSRGGLISLLVVGAAMLLYAGRVRTLVATLALLVGLYAAFAPTLGRYDVTADPTGSQRTVIWQVLLPDAAGHWTTGIGLNATRFHTAGLPGLYEEKSAHNTYVQAFVETGLLGFVALLAVLVAHARLRATHAARDAVRAGLWGLAVSMCFLHMLGIQALWIPWIVAAQVAACRPAPARPVPSRPSLVPLPVPEAS